VFAGRVTPVAEPHAVLARARASEVERGLDEHVARGFGRRALGVVGEHERVHDADPGVPEEMDGEPALGAGGSCSGEHGMGLGNRRYAAREHGAALDLMRGVKALFDPEGILNPGKIW